MTYLAASRSGSGWSRRVPVPEVLPGLMVINHCFGCWRAIDAIHRAAMYLAWLYASAGLGLRPSK